METPKWDLNLLAEKNVYEPAEDTFLLLDSLEAEMETLMLQKPQIVMEIGSGSGVIITAMANLLKCFAHCIAVDINMDACIVTRRTAQLNNAKIDIINSDLLEAFDLREIVDVIICNPPYVQTSDDEASKSGIAKSWAGGIRGRSVLDRVLPVLSKAISRNGIFYLVAIDYNDIDDIIQQMRRFKFSSVVLKVKQFPGELLYVLKFTKI